MARKHKNASDRVYKIMSEETIKKLMYELNETKRETKSQITRNKNLKW